MGLWAEYLSRERVKLTTEIVSPIVPHPNPMPAVTLEMSDLPSNTVVIVMKM